MALLTVVIVILIAGPATPLLIETLLRDGTLAVAWMIACIGVGLWVVRWIAPRRRSSPVTIVPRGTIASGEGQSCALLLATAFAAGSGVIALVVLATGLMGILSRPVAWVILAAGWAGGAVWVLQNRPSQFAKWPSMSVSRWSWVWLIAAPAGAVLVVAPAVLPGVLWGGEPNGYDVVEYHLQVPREWHDAGRISRLDHNVFSTFPFLTEMHFLLAMHLRGGAYAGMYVSQYMNAIFAVFTSIAVYGVLGGRARPQAVVGGVVAIVVPWTLMVGTIAYNEAALMLYGVLCVGWIMTVLNRSKSGAEAPGLWGSVIVAGAMGGFACGVKLTAIPMVVGTAAIAMMIVHPRMWRAAALLLVTAGGVASPWLIRNAIWTGNPVFPQATATLGGRAWSIQQQERWSASHAPRDDQKSLNGRLAALRDQVLLDWKFGFALIPAAIIGLVLARGGSHARVIAFVALVMCGQVLVWLFATHLQGRFLVLSIPLLAIIVGSAARNWVGSIAGLAACIVCMTCNVLSFSSPPVEGDDPDRLFAQPIARLADPRIRACIGVTHPQDLWQLQSPEVADAVRNSDRPIALVGDAKAFWWPVDSKRLFYRTVFDVDRRPGESLIDAWKRGAPANAIVVVDPNESRRFVRTYKGLGELPGEIEGRGESFVRE